MRITLAICAALMAASASAQTTNCQYVVGGITCQTQDPHQYDYLHNAGQQDAYNAGRALGNVVNAAIAPKVAIVSVTRHEARITEIKACATPRVGAPSR